MKKKILLVGASTGGPSQIKELLSSITTLSCTIIIVQHMREEVIPFFINDLKDSLKIKVQTTPVCTSFEIPSVIICSKSSIIEKEGNLYNIKTDTQNQNYTPDINKLFESFVVYAEEFDMSVCIMTGIGRDGVDGAKKLKEKGAKIIAQDEKSSPVFGMPKAAIEDGIVDEIKSIDELKSCFRGF